MKNLVFTSSIATLVLFAGAAQAGSITLDFGDGTIDGYSPGMPHPPIDATPYLNAHGIFISKITPGTTFQIEDDRNPYYPNMTTIASSPHNFAWQQGPNIPMSVTLSLATPVSDVSFYRIGSTGGAATPQWSVEVYDGSTVIASAGQPINGFYQSPPQLYSFTASDYGASEITSIELDSNGFDFAAYGAVGIDDLSFTPLASTTPEPSSMVLALFSAGGWYVTRKYRLWRRLS